MIRHLSNAFMLALAGIMFATQTLAVGLIRDPDIERGLKELASPVLQAAGLSPSRVKIMIVDDQSLNAFVIDHNHIFLNSGLILKVRNPGELQAVIAHEAAHIANGHLSRRTQNLKNARSTPLIGVLLAVAVGASGNGAAATGIAAGSVGTARGAFFGHTRSEESSADQSALRYMKSAGINPAHMHSLLEIFRGQEVLASSRQDPWARSHPLTRDRLRAVKSFVAGNPGGTKDQKAAYWFARVQGKLSAFKRSPKWTLRKAKGSSDIDQMRRVVAYHRSSKRNDAIKEISALVKSRPKDPYYRELQGQILLENRQFKAAVDAYKNAVNLSPNNALILGSYGRSLLAIKSSQADKLALHVLTKAQGIDNESSRILRDLATAYAKTGQPAMAALMAAERYALRGDLKNARVQADRAIRGLKRGTTGWRRAQDIIDAAK